MQFFIEINASRKKVWDTPWQDGTFREGASIIDPETYMVGDLKEGNEIQFISSANGYGVTSTVEKLVEGEFLLLRHHADTQEAGKREREKGVDWWRETLLISRERRHYDFSRCMRCSVSIGSRVLGQLSQSSGAS